VAVVNAAAALRNIEVLAMPKNKDSSNALENRRRFRAIQRLCNRYPPQTADERLEKIAGIASGALPPEIAIAPISADLPSRLAAGAASRSPRVGQPPPVEEQKRRAKKDRDRQEGGGFNRTTDVNV